MQTRYKQLTDPQWQIIKKNLPIQRRKYDLSHRDSFPMPKASLWERRLDKDHEKTTDSAEAWIYRANCQRVLNRLQYNTILSGTIHL